MRSNENRRRSLYKTNFCRIKLDWSSLWKIEQSKFQTTFLSLTEILEHEDIQMETNRVRDETALKKSIFIMQISTIKVKKAALCFFFEI